MPSKSKRSKLTALPVQIIEIPDGVILKRGATEVMITGASAAEAVRMVLDATKYGGASPEAVRRLFSRSSGSQVDALINNLGSRRLLVPKDGNAGPVKSQESHLEVFFWHFGETASRVVERLNTVRLLIIGVNCISRQLTASLMACGHNNFKIVDHPRYRSARMFTTAGKLKHEEWPASLNRPQVWNDRQLRDLGDCLIATSDFGGQQALCEWNKLCLDRKVHFMPVMLKNMIGYVGPMVIPGETACYECFLSRQRSHAMDPDTELITDRAAYDGQGIIGFHPSMATILGDIAAFEFTRFYSQTVPGRKAGQLLEVNLLAGSMTGRTVLKVPRCAACSPIQKTSQANLRKILFPEQAGIRQGIKEIP